MYEPKVLDVNQKINYHHRFFYYNKNLTYWTESPSIQIQQQEKINGVDRNQLTGEQKTDSPLL